MAKREAKESMVKETLVVVRAKRFNNHLRVGLAKLPPEVALVVGKTHMCHEDGPVTIDKSISGNLNPAYFEVQEEKA